MLAAEQVVLAVAALLATAPAMASSVFTDHPHPFAEEALPVWRVGEAEEEITEQGLNYPARQTHELTVNCHGLRRAVTEVRAELNTMAAEALTVLFASKAAASLSPMPCAMVLTRIERDIVTEGEAAVGRVTLSLRVRFHTYSNAPETIN